MVLGLSMDHYLDLYGYWAVFLVVAVEYLGIPLPGETMLVAAGILAGYHHHLAIGWIVATASAASVLGAAAGYLVGARGGYRLLRRFGRHLHINEARLKLGRYLFLRHGGKVVFLGRFVSVLRTYAAFLAGTNRMPWRRFLAFNIAGGIVWASLYGFGSYFLGQTINRVSSELGIAVAVVAVVAVVVGVVLVRRNEARLLAAAEEALPGPLDEAAPDRPRRARGEEQGAGAHQATGMPGGEAGSGGRGGHGSGP
jgi:membrane protein DedA with SNARE-associated domain